MQTNRLVASLTPLVFAPLAAALTGWIAKHFPGLPPVDRDQLVALEIAGFGGAIAIAHKWLHGWQQHERRGGTDDGLGTHPLPQPENPVGVHSDQGDAGKP